MPMFDIAAGTKSPAIRDPMALRQAQRATADAATQQARVAEMNADFYESRGTSPDEVTTKLNQRKQRLQEAQERRLQAQQVQQRSTKQAMELAERASNIAANTGKVPENIEAVLRETIKTTVEPFASLMDQYRGEAFIREDDDPSTYPDYGTVHRQYQQILDMAIADGISEYNAQQLEDSGTKLDVTKDIWTSTQRAEHQEAVRNVQGQMRVISDVTGLVEQLVLEGSDPSVIFGTQGGILNFVSNIKEAVGAGFTYASQVVDGEGNVLLNGPPDSDLEVQALASQDSRIANAISNIKVPEGIHGSEERSRYRSSVVQLAYAQARAMEPSARQLSNQDLAMALETIGANSGNPRTMLLTVLDNLGRGLEDLELRANQAYTQGEHEDVNLSKRDVNMLVFGVSDLEQVINGEQKARNRISNLINTIEPNADTSSTQGEGPEVGSTEWLRMIRDQGRSQ